MWDTDRANRQTAAAQPSLPREPNSCTIPQPLQCRQCHSEQSAGGRPVTLMKIAKPPDTVSPVSPAEQIVVMGLSPEIAAAARKYMAENLAKIQPSTPRNAAPVKPQFTWGAPVSVSSSSELIPIFDANEAADHISADRKSV